MLGKLVGLKIIISNKLKSKVNITKAIGLDCAFSDVSQPK
jgi:hypothetical protein